MCSAYNCSARGIALRYQPRQSSDLSPATNKTICCHGSKANRIRISLRPVDPGRSSFMFLILELVISPTSGRFRLGPCCLSSSTAAPTWREESRSTFLNWRPVRELGCDFHCPCHEDDYSLSWNCRPGYTRQETGQRAGERPRAEPSTAWVAARLRSHAMPGRELAGHSLSNSPRLGKLLTQ